MLTELLTLVPSEVNCGEVYGRLNTYQEVSRQELQICRDDLLKDLRYDFSTQMKALKESKGYCKTKFYKELMYKRNETRIESLVCGDVFKKERENIKNTKRGFSL